MSKPLYVVSGATGNIGKAIAKALLERGLPVRAIGRSKDKLASLTALGAEAAVGSLEDAVFLTGALAGAKAAFVMIPPNLQTPDFAAYRTRITEAFVSALAKSPLTHIVALSSIGAHQPAGLGPISQLHQHEQRLSQLGKLNTLFLRPAYFMENHLQGIMIIKGMGILGSPVKPDLAFAQIATKDIAEVAARRLMALDFTGRSTTELLGARDYTMLEATRILGTAIGKPQLPYVAFPYADARGAMISMGISASVADGFVEMYQGFNVGLALPVQARSPATATPTTLETFATAVFAPAFSGGKSAHG
jgi:uncharacterized protein YbjT (DUF2867 family)